MKLRGKAWKFDGILDVDWEICPLATFKQIMAKYEAKEITKEQLNASVPSFFYFYYPFQPQPGKRLWLRVDDQHFIERYPDGSESKFKILGRTIARVRYVVNRKIRMMIRMIPPMPNPCPPF